MVSLYNMLILSGCGSRVNDIYVYTLSALVYSLHYDQTILKCTLSVKVRTYKE